MQQNPSLIEVHLCLVRRSLSYLDLPSGCYNVLLSVSGGESQVKAFRRARLQGKNMENSPVALISDKGSVIVHSDNFPLNPFGKQN